MRSLRGLMALCGVSRIDLAITYLGMEYGDVTHDYVIGELNKDEYIQRLDNWVNVSTTYDMDFLMNICRWSNYSDLFNDLKPDDYQYSRIKVLREYTRSHRIDVINDITPDDLKEALGLCTLSKFKQLLQLKDYKGVHRL